MIVIYIFKTLSDRNFSRREHAENIVVKNINEFHKALKTIKNKYDYQPFLAFYEGYDSSRSLSLYEAEEYLNYLSNKQKKNIDR